MSIGEIVKMVVDSTASKGVLLTVMCSVGGFAVKQAVTQSELTHTAEWHTQAIKDMKTTQDLLAKGLQDHTVTLARIDGKLDVINQKIDDDRTTATRRDAARHQ